MEDSDPLFNSILVGILASVRFVIKDHIYLRCISNLGRTHVRAYIVHTMHTIGYRHGSKNAELSRIDRILMMRCYISSTIAKSEERNLT